MASVNKVIIVGNLGADPETRYLPSGESVTNIRVATTDRWKDKQSGEMKEATEWHRIAFFGRLAEVAGEVGLLDRALEPADHVEHLTADVDERRVGPDRVGADDDALDQRVRAGHHQRDVLAGARLRLVGVDDEVLRVRVVLGDEAPLHAGREARAAAAAEP